MENKVTIVGVGNVGSACAQWLASREIADITLIDIIEGAPQGKALDLMQAAPVRGFDCKISGTNNYSDTEASDVVVITAGLPRKPGMTREDLAQSNYKIMKDVTEKIVKYSPGTLIMTVTNPSDAMTYAVHKNSGLPTNKVMGLSGVLDSARLRYFVALELGISYKDVTTLVIGDHGNKMVPLIRYTYAGSIPVQELLPKEKLEEIVERTRNGGSEIVSYLKDGSAFFAPGASVACMVEAVLKDKKQILPVSAYLNGEYGEKDIFLGVPAILGKDGVEKIIELDLNDEEMSNFKGSAESVRKILEHLSFG